MKRLLSWRPVINGTEYHVLFDVVDTIVKIDNKEVLARTEFGDPEGQDVFFLLGRSQARIETRPSGDLKIGLVRTLFVENIIIPSTPSDDVVLY